MWSSRGALCCIKAKGPVRAAYPAYPLVTALRLWLAYLIFWTILLSLPKSLDLLSPISSRPQTENKEHTHNAQSLLILYVHNKYSANFSYSHISTFLCAAGDTTLLPNASNPTGAAPKKPYMLIYLLILDAKC